VAQCGTCSGKCTVCGERNPRKLFAATSDGCMIPYCKSCFVSRREIVVEGGEKEKSAVAGKDN